MNIEALSLDQLRAVLAVADAGSFSAAARRFGRAQSAVSYAIAQAEAQLGVQLFDRAGYRPSLTAAGRALLQDIRGIVARADDLQARAKAVAKGVEPEVRLVVDAICSPDRLASCLAGFQSAFPSVSVTVHMETLGMVAEQVGRHRGALGVIATLIDLPDGLTRYALPPTPMTPVASPAHPLSRCRSDEALGVMHEAIQIVLRDRSPRTDGRDHAVFSPRTWRVDDLTLKHRLIREGVGWGCLPDWMVLDDLAGGRLRKVEAPSLPARDELATQAFHDEGHVPGPAMSWIIDRLRADGLG